MARWYYVEAGRATGPVETSFIQEGLSSGQFTSTSLIYREGEAIWKSLHEFAEFSDSAGSLPETETADWILLKRQTSTPTKSFVQLGPFRLSEVKDRLHSGRISFADYAWKQGFEKWERISEIPELVVRHDTFKMELPAIPSEMISDIVVADPPAIPEQQILSSVLKQEDMMLSPAHSTAELIPEEAVELTPALQPEIKPPTSMLEPEPETFEPDAVSFAHDEEIEEPTPIKPKRQLLATSSYIRAGAVMVFVVAMTASVWKWYQDESKADRIAEAEQERHNLTEPFPTKTATSQRAPVAATKPEAVTPAIKAVEPKVTDSKAVPAMASQGTGRFMQILGPEGVDRNLVIRTDAPIGTKITIEIRAKTGEVLEHASFQWNGQVQRTANEMPVLALNKINIPQGYFTVLASAGELKALARILYASNSSQYYQRINAHRKQIALKQQTEKRKLFGISKTFEQHTVELNKNYKQYRTNQKQWQLFYSKWQAQVKKINYTRVKDKPAKFKNDFAFPDMWIEMQTAHENLLRYGLELDTAIRSKRQLASNPKDPATIFRQLKMSASRLTVSK